MKNEGPSLELLLRRLSETPSDFLAVPHSPASPGVVHAPAVVADLLTMYGHSPASLADFNTDATPAAKRHAGVVLVLCWLLAEPALIEKSPPLSALHTLLTEGAGDLAAQLTAEKYLAEPERREEFVRFALARIDLRPAGETLAQSQDHLSALSSAERARVIKASRQAEQRAREIREALARKAAQESADKYTRE
ncbi:MAG: hypothetical protein QM760_21390 [Nibricoccus sp.]